MIFKKLRLGARLSEGAIPEICHRRQPSIALRIFKNVPLDLMHVSGCDELSLGVHFKNRYYL